MSNASSHPDHEAIAVRARRLWQEAGCPAGRDEEFWVRAEQQLLSEAGGSTSPPPLAHTSPPPLPPSPPTAVPPVIRAAVQVTIRPPASKRKRTPR